MSNGDRHDQLLRDSVQGFRDAQSVLGLAFGPIGPRTADGLIPIPSWVREYMLAAVVWLLYESSPALSRIPDDWLKNMCDELRVGTPPSAIRAYEALLGGSLPTLRPSCRPPVVTRSGLRFQGMAPTEPAWAPIGDLWHIFGLSDSFIRRLARTGRVDSFQHPAGNYLIRVQSLRDYCDRRRA